ncbi:MAG: hypothetical protein ABL931_02470 [Usitatibacteraceae bacterium]
MILEAHMSSKSEKFVSLAEARVNRAIKDIRLIGNLSNRNAYSFTDEQVRVIFKALQKELDTAKGRFGNDGGAADSEFRLR